MIVLTITRVWSRTILKQNFSLCSLLKTYFDWLMEWCNAVTVKNLLPPPRANTGHLTILCARGSGEFDGKAFPGWGIWPLLGKSWTGSVRFQVISFFRALESLTAINTCLNEMEEFNWRDRTFLSDWLTKKGVQKLWSIFWGMYKKQRVLKVPITAKNFLARNKSFYRTEQDSAKILWFGWNPDFLFNFQSYFFFLHDRVKRRLGLVTSFQGSPVTCINW